MRLKILGLIAGVALVAACETASEEGAASSGTGESTATMTQSGDTMAAAPAPAPAPQVQAPMGPAPGSQDDLVANVGDRVFFDFDKYNLRPDARETLAIQATWLQKYPSGTVLIEGHCDERGTREYNLALGERRANAVKDYLVALGVAPGRVKTISYGKERPEAMGSNEQAWAQNRRGVTMVSGGMPSG